MTSIRCGKTLFMVAILAAALLAGSLRAHALATVYVGKAVSVAWVFIPLDVGVHEGLFAKYGLSVDITDFGGDAKLQQGLASGSIDFGLGSGPSMAFVAKGTGCIAVAAFHDVPRNISVVVGAKSPIKTVADLKGKLIGVTSAGAMTAWLVHRISIDQGWGLDGIKIAAVGGFESQFAMMVSHQIDGMMVATEAGYAVEERDQGHILIGMEKFAPDFITDVVFARRELVDKSPAIVNSFLKGFFASIDFMKSHKAETSQVAEAVLHESPNVASKTYDQEISILVADGQFDPKAVEVLKKSFVEMGILNTEPSNDQLFTTEFLPVKP